MPRRFRCLRDLRRQLPEAGRPAGGTPSAVVTAKDQLMGYNYSAQMPKFYDSMGHTTGSPASLAPSQTVVVVVAEDVIAPQAAALVL